MHLDFLHIDKYKNIQNKDFDFSKNNGYIALIGENGSGKSNLLEAISIIFSCLYNEQEAPFNYKIGYHLGRESQIIESKEGKIISEKVKYPSSVIACYSGEDLRLWHLAYETYHMQYFNKAINNKLYTPSLLYINKYCWKIAFISLLCASEQGDKNIENFLKSKLRIDETSDVDIYFKINQEKLEKFKEHDALKWFNRFSETDYKVNARVLATTEPNPLSEAIRKQKKCKTIFQYLYLLSQSKQNEINKVDKLITDIEIKIKEIYFNNLSEGEKKLILIECITRILGDKESLILLDEPDAHIHIARKKELLHAIDSFEGQTLLTTHSPVFANQLKENNIYYMDSGMLFNKEKSDIVTLIADKGIDVINGACIVSSKVVVVVEGSGDINYISKAIEHLKDTNPQYELFTSVGFIPQGSADHTEAFYEDIISKLPESVDKIIYLFDNDKAGQLNASKIQGKPKVSTILYKPNYSEEFNNLYYIEDYIPTKYYPEQFVREKLTISGEGEVRYYQLKELLNITNGLKGKISQIKTNTANKIKQMTAEDFISFKPLLDQIIAVIQS